MIESKGEGMNRDCCWPGNCHGGPNCLSETTVPKGKNMARDLEAALREARNVIREARIRVRYSEWPAFFPVMEKAIARIDAALSAASGEANGEALAELSGQPIKRPFWGDDPSGYVNGDLGPTPSEAPSVEQAKEDGDIEPDVWAAMQIASLVSRDVAELPDRTSPPDEPMLLLVTERELQEITMPRIADAIAQARAEGIAAERERIEHACEMIAVDWRDDGQEQKWWAFQYLRDSAIRGTKP